MTERPPRLSMPRSPPGAASIRGSGSSACRPAAATRRANASSPIFTPTGGILHCRPILMDAPQIYYNDHYNIGPAISLPSVRNLANSDLGTITDDAAADASTNTDDRENVYAAYGQYSGRVRRRWGYWQGLRVESTHATYGGNLYNSDTGYQHADDRKVTRTQITFRPFRGVTTFATTSSVASPIPPGSPARASNKSPRARPSAWGMPLSRSGIPR